MPEHNENDRVRIKNIINIDEDDIKTFWVPRYQKIDTIDQNGIPAKKEIIYQKEIEWNFKKGFFCAWGSKFYTLKPLEEKTYPRFLAEHIADKIAEYLLNKEYLATKKVLDSGIITYNNNILNNKIKRKTLMNQIVIGIEEWNNASDNDFDTMLANQFGGDFQSVVEEKVDKLDFELQEIDQDDKPLKVRVQEEIPKSDNKDLQSARDEAEANGIIYSASDTVQTIKNKIIKAMA